MNSLRLDGEISRPLEIQLFSQLRTKTFSTKSLVLNPSLVCTTQKNPSLNLDHRLKKWPVSGSDPSANKKTQVNHSQSSGKEEPQPDLSILSQLLERSCLLQFVGNQLRETSKISSGEMKQRIEEMIREFVLNDEHFSLTIKEIQAIFPALYLSDPSVPVMSAEWSYLHAGALYCLNRGLMPLQAPRQKIYFLGFFLAILAQREGDEDCLSYFEIPATLYHWMMHQDEKKEAPLKEVYAHYFEAFINKHVLDAHLLIAESDVCQKMCRGRRALVKQILIANGIFPYPSHVDQYIYASNHGITCFLEDQLINRILNRKRIEIRKKIYSLAKKRPSIDVEYTIQNEAIANEYVALDREKLNQFFSLFLLKKESLFLKQMWFLFNPFLEM